jgi:GT2 family glycosyltransferase
METQHASERRGTADGWVRVAALLTCHNRRPLTVDAVERLQRQRVGGGVIVHTKVLDAGSTDGTVAVLERLFADADVLRRGADVFWNGGMRELLLLSSRERYDYYLWLNDDTFLDAGALAHLLDAHRAVEAMHPGVPALIAGATRDPDTGAVSYGGVRRTSWRRPLRFDLVQETDTHARCDTVNGNVVLVPHAVIERVGVLDPAYNHGLGDFDYGLRAAARGCGVWVASGTVGTCRRAKPPAAPRGFIEELRHLRGPKGLPLREWMTFARRYGGPMWPVYAISPYLRRLTTAFAVTCRRRAGDTRMRIRSDNP